jgi:hypothetical protein
MNLKDLIAVSGLPGLFKVAANRSNGLIIEEVDSGKKRFASVRKHQFTPLESIAIYTVEDSVELSKVFEKMVEQLEDNPPPKTTADAEVLREYFLDVLPDHDEDRVAISDIKKVIKWFDFIQEHNLMDATDEASQEEE